MPLLKRLLSGVRDAWLIFGAALLLILAAEGAYRLKLRLGGPAVVIEGRQPGHPYSIAAHMAPQAGRTFFDLRGAFDANGVLAALIADRLAPLLTPRVRRP